MSTKQQWQLREVTGPEVYEVSSILFLEKFNDVQQRCSVDKARVNLAQDQETLTTNQK
jgi:hypothetical protein